MKAKVSICIPTFNRKNYLKQALNSIYAQTYKDYEVIVVDDGSTDGTEEMIKNSGLPISYHWQQNRGEPAARNRLIELSQGQFITFLDSDDLLYPDSVERMINAALAEPADVVVYGGYVRIDKHGNSLGQSKKKLYSGNITQYVFESNIIHSCGSMFPKKALEEIGGFDETLPLCADYDLWMRLSLKYRFIALPEPTFKRRRHSTNLSKVSSKNLAVELRVLERFYYEKGGNTVIPQKIAMRRFSREAYRVGKYALKEGEYQEAQTYLRISSRCHLNLKSLVMRALVILKSRHPSQS